MYLVSVKPQAPEASTKSHAWCFKLSNSPCTSEFDLFSILSKEACGAQKDGKTLRYPKLLDIAIFDAIRAEPERTRDDPKVVHLC